MLRWEDWTIVGAVTKKSFRVGGGIALEGMVADGGHPWWPPALATSRPLLGQSLDSGRPAEAQPQQLRGLAKGHRNLRGQSAQEALMTEHMMIN